MKWPWDGAFPFSRYYFQKFLCPDPPIGGKGNKISSFYKALVTTDYWSKVEVRHETEQLLLQSLYQKYFRVTLALQ